MRIVEKRTQCLNCGHTFKGRFCPQCGQKAKTNRLQFGEMCKNLIGPFVGGDSKFLNTCRDLFARPGHLVRNYLLGKRIRYYHPLQMYVYLLTAYAVVSYVLGISDSIFDEMANIDLETEVEASKYASVDYLIGTLAKISSNKLYGTLLIVLFFTFPYRWLFRKCRIARPDGQQLALNLIEQFYTQMYHSCIGLFISIAMLPLCLIKGLDNVLTTIYQVITFVYLILIYRQLMGIKWWKSIAMNLVGIILMALLFMVVLMLIAVPAGVVEGLMK